MGKPVPSLVLFLRQAFAVGAEQSEAEWGAFGGATPHSGSLARTTSPPEVGRGSAKFLALFAG